MGGGYETSWPHTATRDAVTNGEVADRNAARREKFQKERGADVDEEEDRG
jgi:hypothetical protein